MPPRLIIIKFIKNIFYHLLLSDIIDLRKDRLIMHYVYIAAPRRAVRLPESGLTVNSFFMYHNIYIFDCLESVNEMSL